MTGDTGRPTFTAQRRDRILELVRARGTIALRDLAAQLSTSEVTIRRDVRALEADGLLDRRRGGAALPGRLATDPPHHQKTRKAVPEKLAIARLAGAMVADGDTVVLGPGTTTEALAGELATREDLTVVTNSLPAAWALATAPGVEVVMTGGSLRGSMLALVGTAAEQSLGGLRVRHAFLSGNGVNGPRGVSTPNPAMAGVDIAIAGCAEQVVILADHTKVGAEAMVQTLPTESITHLVTDSRADPEVLLELEEYGVRVHVAVVEAHRGD